MKSLEGCTIAVTGCTGFIGSHLVEALKRIADVRLVLLSRSLPGKKSDRITWINGSLESLSSKTWCDAGIDQIDVVFHLGAFTPKSGADANDMESSFQANLNGTRSLLESLPPKTGRVIFASTLDVYSMGNSGNAFTETSQVHPHSIYGASKLFCEHLTRIYAQQRELQSAILRIGHIYGPGEEAYAKLIPVVIRRVLSGEPPVIYGQGGALRDFLYVGDAVEAILRAATVPVEHLGPVNIVSGSSVSVADVVRLIANLAGYSGEIEHRETATQGRSFRFDPSLMRETLGHWPLVTLEDGLALEIKHVRKKANNNE